MFEAKLRDGSILKRIVEAIKDVVNEVNIDVSQSGKSAVSTASHNRFRNHLGSITSAQWKSVAKFARISS